ncbi:ribosomal protein L16, mitochondrion [Artemisia annua]|uniref:Large ribosomal subunit protein uL16m n=1 Tax=Artemisia annua TaxID=35608 RepID=A0A2U1P0V5_ARTAN|nr:ribosomal protein L16, mitochondrion [Artemisia annua]
MSVRKLSLYTPAGRKAAGEGEGDWARVLADLPITGKPTEVRMGRGKGNPAGWIARVSTGQIPFEMDGVSLSNARQAATLAAHKLCASTKFVQWS